MKLNLKVVAFLLLMISLSPMAVVAQTTAGERAQAFVCAATGKCLLSQASPQVQKTLADITEIESSCRTTTKGVVSVQDRIAFARADLDVGQDLMVLMVDFKPIARKHCASISIDAMLRAYVLERNNGANHAGTVASLLSDPRPSIRKWKKKG